MREASSLVNLIFMKAALLGLLGLAFSVGCAQKPVQPSVNLTQLFYRHLRLEKRQERFNFSRVLENARHREQAQIDKKYPLPSPLNEQSLYSAVVRAYQARQLGALDYYVSQFVYRFPQSVFADSALYLRGETYLILGMTPEALRDFQRILTDYPEGKKYVAALYGKAVCYQQLGLYKFSEEVLQQIRHEFPGSPEVLKAGMEEKVLQAERGTGRQVE